MECSRYRKMPNMAFMSVLLLTCISNFCPSSAQGVESSMPRNAGLETYIVHVKSPNGRVLSELEDLESWYRSFMPTAIASPRERSRLVYTYRNVVTGFAAKLSPEEAKAMEKKDGFLSARPQRVYALHTTHSPNFLGLQQSMGVWGGSNYGKGVIIGVLDTGVTPDHPSFSDLGVPPPPAKWKGRCLLNGTACNNKLIGARSFLNGETTPLPIDEEGHGTHTSSTAAGNMVKDANVFGNANGTAAGMAPLAHLAIYKVCSVEDCTEADILAAMDAAVEDGVDVLSLSLGIGSGAFFQDSIAIGAFGAMEKGIFVSCSAGNSGPFNASLSNEAPWILTVGASTIDRSIKATAMLGNKLQLEGESLFQPKSFPSTLMPLVYPTGVNEDLNITNSLCGIGSFKDIDVKGKVVLCERGGGIGRIDKGQTVKDAGGAAMIMMNDVDNGESTIADPHVLPATHVGFKAGSKIKVYIKSSKSPMATILFGGTVIGVKYAPEVTSFSSRGPSLASPGILKPDIIGPGVSIVAAWPFSVDNRTITKSTFNMISGTSMSCPHLSGIAALLKSAHPSWSPAAIKSAIMTTADLLNLNGTPIIDEKALPADIFAIGAGHVNPSRANDPGLVYDIEPNDYLRYLCGLGYSDKQIGMITRRVIQCSTKVSIPEAQLNYPSFSISLMASTITTFTRTVTNVGEPNSSYDLEVSPPPGVAVTVKPNRLVFSKANQQMTYQVTFSRLAPDVNTPYVQGSLKWYSSKRFVRSPISVKLT